MKRTLPGLLFAVMICVGVMGAASAQDDGPGGPPPGGPPPGGFGGPPGGGPPGGLGGPGGPGGGMMGGLGLLRMTEVQKELKMTSVQVAQVSTKDKELRDQMRAQFQTGGGPDGDPEDREKMFAQIQAKQKKAVADILTADQLKRYDQLVLQQQGAMALTHNTEVQTALKLTDDQKANMEDIQNNAREEMRSSFQGQDFQSMTNEERAALRTKMQTAQKATGEKILAVLTDDQKKQWTDMLGTPFKFPAVQFRRGGPGGGGPGGDNGGPPGGPPPGQ